jgi:hypothetical protein
MGVTSKRRRWTGAGRRRALEGGSKMKRNRMGWSIVLMLLAAAVVFLATPAAQAFNCKIVQCAAPQCEDNEHLAVPPGECCPVCVPN